MAEPDIRKIAILNPLGDFGINQYCYELSEGLASNGVQVDVFTNSAPGLPAPRNHRRFCLLGNVLFKQTAALRHPTPAPAIHPAAADWAIKASTMMPEGRLAREPGTPSSNMGWKQALRRQFLRHELAVFLKLRGYDTVWTQWPDMGDYGLDLWATLRKLGIRVVHTVHNVLPHEDEPRHRALCASVYSNSNALIVHSKQAQDELIAVFPETKGKIIRQFQGTYTLYPSPAGARERVRHQLNVGPAQRMVLVCGAIRPYKNIDATVAAMRQPGCEDCLLVVAGTEAHFADCSPSDPLAHTRALVRHFQVEDRVRLIPRFLSISEMSELFLAADIALLPYLKGYGSAMLMLAITFGRFIVASRTGGAEEYLDHYPAHSLLSSTCDKGIGAALRNAGSPLSSPPDLFDWRLIARDVLSTLQRT